MTPKKVERYGFTEYRTKELGRSGISLVIAYKKSIEGGSLSNTFRRIWERVRGRNPASIAVVGGDEPPQPQPEQAPDPEPAPPSDNVERYFAPFADRREAELRGQLRQFEEQLQDDIDEFESLQRMGGWEGTNPMNNLVYMARDRIRASEGLLRGARDRLNTHLADTVYIYLANRPVGNSRAVRQAQARFDEIRGRYVNRYNRLFPIADRPTEREAYREPNVSDTSPTEREEYMGEDIPQRRPPTFIRGRPILLAPENEDDITQVEEYIQDEDYEITPRGNGIYMKGFGRMGSNRMKGGRIVGGMISDDEEDEDEDYDEDAILEYNALVAEIIDDLDTNDVYLENDENDIISGRIVVPNKAEVLDRIQQKMEEYDTVRGVISDIIDKNQSLAVARLVKEYMDEYILIDTPFIDPLQWRGGALARYDV
jgi:hypothetical protein